MCNLCVQAKNKQKSIRTEVQRTTRPFELVHSDLCGPFATPSSGETRYFILFVDDYSRWMGVWLLPNKQTETCKTAYQSFQKRIGAMRGCRIRHFRCGDGWGE